MLRRSVLAVVLAALALRLVALFVTADARPIKDEETYVLRAEALLDGRGYLGSYRGWVEHPEILRPADLPQYPGAWQPPGQVTFMAAVMALSGRSLFAIKLAQVLLSAASVWLVYAIGLAWFDHRSGLAAAWLCAVYPNLIAFSHYLWSETLFTFLWLAGLALIASLTSLPSAARTAAAGVMLGLAALTRGTLLYFLPLLAAWLVWVHRDAARVAIPRAALMVGVALLCIAPWAARNTLLHDGLVLIETNGPYNLWRGNGRDTYAFRGDPRAPHYRWPFDGLPIAPVGNRGAGRLVAETRDAHGIEQPTDLQITGHAADAAWDEIRTHPGAFIGRVPIRMIDMWNPTSFLVRHFEFGAYGEVPPVLAGLVTALAAGTYVGLLGLAGVGIWTERRHPGIVLVLVSVLFFSAISAVSFGLTRFRLPLIPLLAIAAGPVAAALLSRWRPVAPRSGVALLLACLALGCGGGEPPAAPRPNVLWVVWDTVRADRMSLYGHERPTTPRLDAWAEEARVFEDVRSPAGYTLPSHASMFTGLLPSEHCTHNGNKHLDDRFTTLAERLRDAGYNTFLFSANPHVTDDPRRNLAQGFEVVLHPWSERFGSRAESIVREKIAPEDRSSSLGDRFAAAERGEAEITDWNIKAAGALAGEALTEWLDSDNGAEPWFAFVNYMEAHRPYLPPRRYRELWMDEKQVEASYQVDRSWLPIWEYSFGLREYSPEELELTRATYDAALRELDDLFGDLIASLEARGALENTIVVVTSDHGEHLGEQHMFDHQYTLYEPVLRVPLVLWYPAAVDPGRDPNPVSTLDLFRTLIRLTGLSPSDTAGGVDLLAPQTDRTRLAEDPSGSGIGVTAVSKAHPDWEPPPLGRSLSALAQGPHKYIRTSDGHREVYDLEVDPGELHDLSSERPSLAEELEAALASRQAARPGCPPTTATRPAPEPKQRMSKELRKRLEALGYLNPGDPAE